MSRETTAAQTTGEIAAGDATPPAWRTLSAARSELGESLEAFCDAALAASGEDTPPALAVRVTAGVGKTRAMLEMLARRGGELLERGHVMVHLPTHELAEQALAEFQSMGTTLPAMVLRGRSAADPSNGDPLCAKAELAERIGRLGLPVRDALCQTRNEIGRTVKAPCRRGCRYYAQMPKGPSIIFLAHAYLGAGAPVSGDVALRIVDEKCIAQVARTRRLSIEQWLPGAGDPQASDTRIAQARRRVFESLMTGEPVIAALRAAGFDRCEIEAFARCESQSTPRFPLRPNQTAEDQAALLEKFDAAALRAGRLRARIWSLLAERWSHDDTERLSLGRARDCGERGPGRYVLEIHTRRPLERNAPLLLLDADADPRITEAIAPDATFQRIDVHINAQVIQVRDRTLSKASLLSYAGHETLRAELRQIIAREAGRAQSGALLVAPRDVLRQLHRDVSPDARFDADEELLQPLLGATPRWFGPGLQGLNSYRDHDVVILAGRLQPRAEIIENDLRALFGDRDAPLRLLDPGQPGLLPQLDADHLMRDGTLARTRAPGHPDPRGAALLALHREAHSLQALARLRALDPDAAPKRVVILSSIPLPGLRVSELRTWKSMVHDLPDAALAHGPKMRRLEAAIVPPGRSPVLGLRLSKRGIAEDAPWAFLDNDGAPLKSGAHEWMRGLSPERIETMVRAVASRHGLQPTFLRLRPPSGGRPVPAAVFAASDEAAAVAARLWPDHSPAQ